MKKHLKLILLLSVSTAPLSGQVYPLSENSWSNPEFVERFLGTYGFDTEITPDISREEGEVFREVSRIAAQNPSGAIQLLRQSITPDSSAAMDFALANFLLQESKHDEAIRAYEASIKKFPNFFRSYKNLGLVYIQTQNYKLALKNLTKALSIGGGDGGLYGLIGYCHLNLDHPGSALDAYRFALLYEPDGRDWRLGQLKALQKLRRYDEVEGIIYRYIKEDPDQPEFWLQQANAFIAQKKFGLAAANLEIVEALGGSDSEAQVLLGDIYVNLEAPLLALEPYTKAIMTGKVKVSKALDLAKMLSRRIDANSLEGFLGMISEAYKGQMNTPDSLTLLTLQAGNALSQDKKELAMELLSQVVAKDPLNGAALLTLGRYYLAENEVEKALDYYGRAEKVASVKIDALMGSARALVQNKQYREAIIRLKEAQTIKEQPFVSQYINTLENFIN